MADKDDDKQPKPLTADDIRSVVREVVADAVNAAVTARMKRELQGDDFKNSITELVKAAVAEGGGKGKGKKGKADDGDDEGGATGEVAELKKLILEERQKREEAEAARAKQEERGALVEALTAAGVAKEMLQPALALLYAEEKRVARDESGQVVWRGDDPVKPHKPLADGVKEWIGSDLGKRFLPPRDVAGSGSRGAVGTTDKDGNTNYSDGDLGNLLAQM